MSCFRPGRPRSGLSTFLVGTKKIRDKKLRRFVVVSPRTVPSLHFSWPFNIFIFRSFLKPFPVLRSWSFVLRYSSFFVILRSSSFLLVFVVLRISFFVLRASVFVLRSGFFLVLHASFFVRRVLRVSFFVRRHSLGFSSTLCCV